MGTSDGFVKYRGQGRTADGRPAPTPGEDGAYLADDDLVAVVNAMLIVEQPLLVTGEPGTGKTVLAESVAAELEMGPVLRFTVRSDSQGRDLLYEFDNLRRFYDAQNKDARASDRANYVRPGALGTAIQSDRRRVVLVDEIDKAPRDFPNDLLDVLDRMILQIPEIDLEVRATRRPVVIITSNRESQLPDPFLRRCVFHHIAFPDAPRLREILAQRLGHLRLEQALQERIVARFVELRAVPELQKRPATSEMLAWARILHGAQVRPSDLDVRPPQLPFLCALLKTSDDHAKLRSATA